MKKCFILFARAELFKYCRIFILLLPRISRIRVFFLFHFFPRFKYKISDKHGFKHIFSLFFLFLFFHCAILNSVAFAKTQFYTTDVWYFFDDTVCVRCCILFYYTLRRAHARKRIENGLFFRSYIFYFTFFFRPRV